MHTYREQSIAKNKQKNDIKTTKNAFWTPICHDAIKDTRIKIDSTEQKCVVADVVNASCCGGFELKSLDRLWRIRIEMQMVDKKTKMKGLESMPIIQESFRQCVLQFNNYHEDMTDLSI
eukprot:222494_1